MDDKIYTSTMPEIAEKQRERRKIAVQSQLPLIVECLLEDDELLGQLAAAIAKQSSGKSKKK